MIRIIHPTVVVLVGALPLALGWVLLIAAVIIFASDFTATVFAVIGLNKHLEQLQGIAKRLKDISDELGENITEYTLNVMEKNEQIKGKVEEYKQDAEVKMETYRLEAQELLNNQKDLLAKSRAAHKRLVRAFPKLSSKRFELGLNRMKDELLKRSK